MAGGEPPAPKKLKTASATTAMGATTPLGRAYNIVYKSKLFYWLLFVVVCGSFSFTELSWKRPMGRRITTKRGAVIYSAIIGSYEAGSKPAHRTKPASLNIPCILLTDNKDLARRSRKDGWKVYDLKHLHINYKQLHSIPSYASRPNVWIQRYLKIHPHVIPQLASFSDVLWVDGNVELNDISEFMGSQNDTEALVVRRHPTRSNVSSELGPIEKICGNSSNFTRIRSYLSGENGNFTDSHLTVTNILLRRRFHSRDMKQFASVWFRFMKDSNCWRDQSSFDLAMELSSLAYRYSHVRARTFCHSEQLKKLAERFHVKRIKEIKQLKKMEYLCIKNIF